MGWPDFVRRYVWDPERTPYLVRPERLTARQARSELFAYAFLLAVVAAVAVVLALGGRAGPLGEPLALYAASVAAAAVALGATGRPGAAAWCATAPLVVAAAALVGVLRPEMGAGERVVLGAAGLLWLGYAARVVRIARRFAGRD